MPPRTARPSPTSTTSSPATSGSSTRDEPLSWRRKEEPVVGILWPNGERDTAPTWEELETRVREKQWEPRESRVAFRNDMAVRTMHWSGTEIETDGDSRDFFY